MSIMSSLFVSYSRKDIDFARKLTNALKSQELDFWIDWEGIPPTVDWWREIEKGIEEADIFLFLISPDSARSKICGQEIDTAVKNGKRIIPIVVREIQWEDTPPQLGHLNYIFFSRDDDFDTALKKLLTAIQTDYAWATKHREIQVKALEWERSNKDNSFHLRGKELTDAEIQLATHSSKEPHPTDLQREYVLKSRQATDKQRRMVTSIAIAGVVALAALAIFGFVQANNAQIQAAAAQANEKEAQKQLRISRAGELAFMSQEIRETDFQISLLLGIEGFRSWETIRSYGNLLDITISTPQLIRYMPATAPNASVAFSPDGNYMVSAWCQEADQLLCLKSVAEVRELETGILIASTVQEGRRLETAVFMPDGENILLGGEGTLLWNTTTGNVDDFQWEGGGFITRLTISPDGRTLAGGSWDGVLTLWDMKTLQVLEQMTATSFSGIAFSPDGKTFAYGMMSDEWRVVLWDLQTKEQIGESITNESNIIAFSPDGKTIALVGSEITLWDVNTRSQAGHLPLRDGLSVSGIAFGPDGKILISSQFTGDVILWDLAPRQAGDILIYEEEQTAAVAPDNNTSGKAAQLIQKLEEEGNITALSPDGKMLVSASWDIITFWDTETQTMIGQPRNDHKYQIFQIVFSPDGETLVSRSDEVILWNAKTQEPIGEPLANQIENIVYSPDSKMFGFTSYQYKPDSDNLISTIALWDISSQQQVNKQPIEVGDLEFYKLRFSPDAKAIVLTNGDGSTISWSLNPQHWIEISCQRAGRNFTRAEWERYFPNEEYRKTCEQ